MNILVIGGTVFLGRHIVEAALAQGHTVTLFNRGKTNPHLFPQLEKLIGDRQAGDYAALAGRRWDAIIDPSAYIPRAVRELLTAASCDHYTLISSISVYADSGIQGQDEGAAVLTLADPTTEEVTGETYGGLKVLCEQTAAAHHAHVLTVRSGLIVGAHDPTDRFTYWPVRVGQGGRMLAPGAADYALQLIDVRDQAAWIVRCVEQQVTGAFNVTGRPTPIGDILETAKTITQSDAQFVWVDGDWCAENDVAPWQDLPLWIPGDAYAGFHHYNVDKAAAAGLTWRPIADTITHLLAWHESRPADYELKTGLRPDAEAAHLKNAL